MEDPPSPAKADSISPEMSKSFMAAYGKGTDTPLSDSSAIYSSTLSFEDRITSLRRASSDMTIIPTAREKLARMFTDDCVISTASSFANLPDLAKEKGTYGSYREIGAGACGIVYEELGECKAIKLAKTMDEQLENDWQFHVAIVKAFDQSTILHEELQIPKVFDFIRRTDDAWWEKYKKLFPDEDRVKEQMDVLITEQILPLPEELRYAIIDEWCLEHLKKAAKEDPRNKDCLIRVYFGQHTQHREKPLTSFPLRNYNLHVDKIVHLEIERAHRLRLAHTMGKALAVMHWSVGTDAHDVEFVLGSSPTPKEELTPPKIKTKPLDDKTNTSPKGSTPPKKGMLHGPSKLGSQHNYKRRAVRLWMLDFNQCRKMSKDKAGIDLAVQAFFHNHPYFPRPLCEDVNEVELWDDFARGYEEESTLILRGADGDEKDLPKVFLDACIDMQLKKNVARMEAEKKLKMDRYGPPDRDD